MCILGNRFLLIYWSPRFANSNVRAIWLLFWWKLILLLPLPFLFLHILFGWGKFYSEIFLLQDCCHYFWNGYCCCGSVDTNIFSYPILETREITIAKECAHFTFDNSRHVFQKFRQENEQSTIPSYSYQSDKRFSNLAPEYLAQIYVFQLYHVKTPPSLTETWTFK